MTYKREGGFLIAKIHQLSRSIFSRMLKEHGIDVNPGYGRVLFALWREDRIPIGHLTRRTLLGKSTLTEVLDGLEKVGYVVRIPSREDRRVTLIELTEKSQGIHDAYEQVSREMTNLFYRGLHDEEIDGFEGFLERLLDNLIAFDSIA